ncbi:MAG: SIMPL domain-containing protein [Bacteroides sp.]|nr:SIMPL domain-containing protein [Ruminococcus flavefaciens]MCM1554617.1 SIMPL domain-containing protein [Bacteroides sp.]
MKNFRLESIVLGIALIALGWLVGYGIQHRDNDRTVTVRGLSERTVQANKVTWPICFKAFGNDIGQLYADIQKTRTKVLEFLNKGGISESEITVKAPMVEDRKTNMYSDEIKAGQSRFYATCIITVTSSDVEAVRKLISSQEKLLSQGIVLENQDWRGEVYEYTALNDIKPDMIAEATKNAREAAEKFAKDSHSKVGKIKTASQGSFSIADSDATTPHVKNIRVVTTITYLID